MVVVEVFLFEGMRRRARPSSLRGAILLHLGFPSAYFDALKAFLTVLLPDEARGPAS